jgi:hypothetical protein
VGGDEGTSLMGAFVFWVQPKREGREKKTKKTIAFCCCQ